MLTFLLHVTGIDNVSGRWYGFWSGIGGDFGMLSIAAAWARGHNCHVHGCWRWGGKPVAGTPWQVCRRHHVGPKVTAEAVAAAIQDPTTPPEAQP